MIHGMVWTTIVDMNLSVSVLNSCHGVADLSKCVEYCVVVQSRTELRAQHIQNWVGDRGVVLPHSIRNSSPPPIRIPLALFLENKVMWCRCYERLKNKAEGSKDRDEVNRRQVCECDGWVCVLEVIGAPSRLRLIRKDAADFQSLGCLQVWYPL